MFERGNDYLVFIKRDTEEDWRVVACIVSNELNISSEVIETSSRCDGNWANHVNGKKSYSIDISGVAISNTLEPSQISHEILYELSVSGEPFGIRVSKVGDLYIREGRVTITDYKENQTVWQPFSFSATLLGKGKIQGRFFKYLADNLARYITPENGDKIIVKSYGNQGA